MRRVDRSALEVPKELLSQKVMLAKGQLAQYFALPLEERQQRRPPLNPQIWTISSLREALHVAFVGKCAYCETPIRFVHDAHLDHFRPTGGADDGRRGKGESPSFEHYSWFAYEWRNHMLACAECNRSKRNLFPVDGPRASIRSSWDEAETSERALMINPCKEEPRRHLTFGIDGHAFARNPSGEATIGALSLNRAGLIEARAEKFKRCLNLLGRCRREPDAFVELRAELADEAPFTGSAQIVLFDLANDFSASHGYRKLTFRNLADELIRLASTSSEDQWSQLAETTSISFNMSRQEPVLHLPLAEVLRTVEFYEAKPSTAQLRRIKIQNFKGIAHLDLTFPDDNSEGGALLA